MRGRTSSPTAPRGPSPMVDGGRASAASRWTRAALVAAAALGLVHAAFSLYWALGGDWLLVTLGARIVSDFGDQRWLLFPVAAVKAVFAVLPVWLASRGWPWRLFSRLVCWLGAVVLAVWGGVNTVVGNLVLAGVVAPSGGFDRPGMIGHAWLWDPLFLAWGLLLAVGLLGTRSRRPRAEQR